MTRQSPGPVRFSTWRAFRSTWTGVGRSLGALEEITAGMTDPFVRFVPDEFDLSRKMGGSRAFRPEEVRAEVFLVIVREDGDDDGVRTEFVLSLHGADEVAPGGDPHPQPHLRRHLLRGDDGIAVTHADDRIQEPQVDDGGNEFVGDALDAVFPDFVARRQRRRFQRFERVDPDRRILSSSGTARPP